MSIRRYVSALLVIMIAVTFLLTGCQSADVPTHPLDALDIPETGYEMSFSPVESAVLYVGETQQTIDPDDPRLMRVLNLLGYAAETGQYVRTQGVFSEAEIDQYCSDSEAVLEVFFAADPEDSSEFRHAPKIRICADTYFLYMKNGTDAEIHRPYLEQAPENVKQSGINWNGNGECWLDILEYCGF